MQFFQFTKNFPDLSISDKLNKDSFKEAMNTKQAAIKKIRDELNSIDDISYVEAA